MGYFLYESFMHLRVSQSRSFWMIWGVPLSTLFFTFWLVKKQPDLGTALLILFQGLGILWVAGLSRRFFLYGALCCLFGAPLIFMTLKPYQKQRLYVLCGYGEKHKERYQVEQALIAIGSGGLTGKGFLQGTQNKFSFLPEDHSDLIFAILCEEWGIIGAAVLFLLYFLLALRILWRLFNTDDYLRHLVGIGQLLHIMLAVLVNAGMVMGILPIVGVPLPLMSYGLSYLWVTLASLGVLQGE
jgi:rod shape determining protein RodA